jgi:predicted AAA+ superfamily ATPase
MFDIFRDYLLGDGVDTKQILMLNFEDTEYDHLSDYRMLYEYIKPRLLPGKMNYIFLDEIQHVAKFEKTVDSLFIRENCDVYITGSNAYFMSGELATLLSGRYIELKMLPLSFREFSSGQDGRKSGLSRIEKFNLYVENGSLPYVLRYADGQREAMEYMRDVYNSVLLKDVVARLKISDVNVLENVTKFMFHNIGNKMSPTKIANTLKSEGRGVDQKTVDRYVRGLTDSLMFYESMRYNIKGRQLLSTQSKYYAVDMGLRNMLIRGKESDIGHVLENIVFLELKRRGYEAYVGQLDAGEVDFVAAGSEGVAYYQVAATALNEETLKRELTPLKKIADNYPKYLLTQDEAFGSGDYDGIIKRNLLDWLLEN